MRPVFLVLSMVMIVRAPQLVLSATAPSAPPVHVDAQNPSASNTNPGSEALPLKTINRAVEAASGSAVGGSPAVVVVHPGIYREAITVTKPTILIGQPGAEIRGSDVWATGWTQQGTSWSHPGVPTFRAHGNCDGKPGRCLWPEQVFYDGNPLLHVAGTARSGEFAVSSDRVVTLADNPAGHLVEVTVRTRWIAIKSSGVTIRGFRMRHAANDSQSGALQSNSDSNVTVENNVLSDAHGAVISLSDGSNLRIAGNDISRGGQLGIHMSGATDSIVEHNRIHENNTEAFSWGWEAGGLKASRAARLTIASNEVYGNEGPGLWCDGDCQDVVFDNNRIQDNKGPGIQYEISHRARISNNSVWKNGLALRLRPNHWGWGAGILVQNSDGCDVFKNTLAWNSNGISVLEQNRGNHVVSDTSVHDNTIVAQDAAPGGYVYALAWLSDHSMEMFSPARHNAGWSNKYGYSGAAEAGRVRFAWGGRNYGHLEEFSRTSGERQATYLTRAEQDSLLSSSQIPLSP